MASGSSLASAEEPQVLSEGPPVLLHVPRFCSSIIVAAIAEAGLGQVRVRIVGYPDELRSTELAEQTGGLARVPSLVGVSGAPLLESSAILEYLLETPPLGDGTPIRVGPGDPLRGQYLSLLAFSAATVKPLVSNQIFLAGLAPEPDTAAIEAATAEWTERVGPFLQRQLGDEEFFVAGRLTAVDLALAKPLGNAQAAGLLEAFPSLKAHYGRISLRPSHLLAYSPQAPGVYRVKATEQGGYVFEDAAGDAGERL